MATRMSLSEEEAKQYDNLKKGYEGECQFDEWIAGLPDGALIVNDLLFKHNNTIFQIDSLLITLRKIYLFEVKNYTGDIVINGDKWCMKSGSEIKNPLLQLQRSESLLRQLFHHLKINLPIEAYLVFVNPDMMPYNAPPELPAIFHSQLGRFFGKLNSSISKLTPRHEKIAETLVAAQTTDSLFENKAEYSFGNLRKGLICPKCGHFMVHEHRSILSCGCGYVELVDHSVLRMVDEYGLLFPERKVTTKDIYQWCGEEVANSAIRRILSNEYKLIGTTKRAYFIKK
ncbi:NERD domain-containing protein [Bacillaceae bacterium S4-13-56]